MWNKNKTKQNKPEDSETQHSSFQHVCEVESDMYAAFLKAHYFSISTTFQVKKIPKSRKIC